MERAEEKGRMGKTRKEGPGAGEAECVLEKEEGREWREIGRV